MKNRHAVGLEGHELGLHRGWGAAGQVRGLMVGVAVLSTLFAAGCGPEEPPPIAPNDPTPSSRPASVDPPRPKTDFDAPTAAQWSVADTERVETVCAACHALPAPESLTRERWELVIPSMAVMPGLPAVAQPTDEELGLALAYYTRRAPASLGAVATYPLDSPLSFDIEHFTPPGLERERIPAVANVRFVHMERPDRAEILISEMRTRALMLHIPWAPEPVRSRIRMLVPELDYPVRTELFDFNGDGLDDLITAGIGGMNPSDDVRGRVSITFQTPDRKFQRHTVHDDVARPCDVQPADLDGDGDQDLLVTAFGWRGPGELFWLENLEPGRVPPRFAKHLVDDRDGAIHVAPHDFDGDGDLDFATVISQEHELIVLYLNDGAGVFRPHVIHQAPHPAWGYSGLELTDLDRDGDRDLLIVNGDTLDDDLLKPYHGVRWLENRGELRFVAHDILMLAGCEAATAVDLDNDGDTDVVAVAFLPQIPSEVWRRQQLDSVVWAENTGRGPNGFEWRAHSLEKGRCYHPTVDVEDYNGDGKMDIAVGNYVWIPTDGSPPLKADYLTLFSGR